MMPKMSDEHNTRFITTDLQAVDVGLEYFQIKG